ncbi:hypothetical protein ANN_04220 [Periplaneta americana]|uniref:Uncharacterized protein n=1 Tax=Periplaneta americana TaxID=6978 RepID=A0ABQ8T7Z0_PERAM|nr:hypothetical protein ANN_04220 [Periplaneta americana]
MAGLCERGNEPADSLKVICWSEVVEVVRVSDADIKCKEMELRDLGFIRYSSGDVTWLPQGHDMMTCLSASDSRVPLVKLEQLSHIRRTLSMINVSNVTLSRGMMSSSDTREEEARIVGSAVAEAE